VILNDLKGGRDICRKLEDIDDDLTWLGESLSKAGSVDLAQRLLALVATAQSDIDAALEVVGRST
jgi:hypothetical protein